jgi:virginiamycin A acetyltransferase
METYTAVTTYINKGLDQIITESGVRMGAMSKYLSTSCQSPINISEGSCVNRCHIGKYFNVGLYSYIADTQIGRYCSLASRVSIGAFNHPTNWLSSHEFSFRDTSSIWGESSIDGGQNLLQNRVMDTIIGNDVWIGDNVVVLKGVTIGDGAILGASSVITHNVLPYSIVVGNPGRVVRLRFHPSVIEQLLTLKWWEWDMADLKGLDFSDMDTTLKKLNQRRMIPVETERTYGILD